MSLDSKGYPLVFIQKKRCKDSSDHLFTYIYKFHSPKTKYNYIVLADLHTNNVFAIKFYAKKDKRSDFKYSKLTNKGDVANILISCLNVIPVLLELYPDASFGFIASRSIDKYSLTIEAPANTQRFRIYKEIINTFIGFETFEHIIYNNISGYLLINKKNLNILSTENAIKSMIISTYNTLENL